MFYKFLAFIERSYCLQQLCLMNIYYHMFDHSRSPRSVSIESPYATSY